MPLEISGIFHTVPGRELLPAFIYLHKEKNCNRAPKESENGSKTPYPHVSFKRLRVLLYLAQIEKLLMTIIYGTKSFLIKKTDPATLGINSLKPGSMIEVYQKCFTLFLLPMFPYEREVIYTRDGETYNIPRELKEVTEKYKGTVSGKWYSFGILWVPALLALLYFSINFAVKQSQPKLWEQMHEESVATYKKRLDRLDDRYIILIQDIGAGEENVLYVTQAKGNDIMVTMDLDSIPKKVKRSDLKAAVTEDYDDVEKKEYASRDLFGDGKLYTLVEVRMEFGPKIKIEDTEVDAGNPEKYLYKICNDGWPVTVDYIKMLKGEMEWDLKFPFKFDTCMQVAGIKKSDYIEMELGVKDTLGRPYKYVFSNSAINNEYLDDVE